MSLLLHNVKYHSVLLSICHSNATEKLVEKLIRSSKLETKKLVY